MRILHINDNHNIPGGAEAVLIRQVAVLGRNGFELSVACVSGSATEQKFKRRGISTIPVANMRKNPLAAARELGRVLRRDPFDIVHTAGPLANFSGRLAGGRMGVPVITTVHCEPDAFLLTSPTIRGRLSWRLRQAVDSMTAGYANAFIAVSETVAKKLRAQGVAANKITLIPNGIDVAGTKESASETPEVNVALRGNQVGLVARLEEVKGISYLIKAIHALITDIPDIGLVVVGDGSKRQRLIKEVKELNMEDRVNFVGYVENPLPLVAGFSVFALPSLSEGLNITLLEAMALRRPVVATNVGGNPEVVRRGCGLIVPPRDPRAMATAIGKMIENPKMASGFGEAAARLVEESFSETIMCDRLMDLYQRVARKN